MFSRLVITTAIIASLFSLTAQARELLVEISQGETIKVNVENINTLDTLFLTEAEKNDIPATSVDGVPLIARQAFYDYAKAASKATFVKEYTNKGVLFTVIRIDDKAAILVDDDLLSVDSNSEPAPRRPIPDDPENGGGSSSGGSSGGSGGGNAGGHGGGGDPGRCLDAVVGAAIAGAAAGATFGSPAGVGGAAVGAAGGSIAGALTAHGTADACNDGSGKSLGGKIWDYLTGNNP